MKSDKMRESDNIEDRRGQGSGSFGGSSSGNGSQLLLQLLFSSGSWKTKLVILLVLLLFGGFSSLSGILTGDNTANYDRTSQVSTNNTTASDQDAQFVSKVLASTEEFWSQKFRAEGMTYNAPTLVFYTNRTTTGCGLGQAQAGPFYCPADKKIYIDLTFYQELTTKYKAAGDFAMAYVIAHEVGHHVQNEIGTMSSYNKAGQGLSEKASNALNVRLELQADYYAGAWAKYVDDQGLLDTGDIQEALNAAHAVGDDTLQQEAYGKTVPDSFTHGTSEQRKRWFDRGYQYGDFTHGDTFKTNDL
ncbi:KPN_02809 family neutral zinc metallopeptidase [Streptococcus ferus]|uniref:KPN_02809 family neutral zinc metallopeptidase n=1 Tax=Streptococcus ferus TaxID=1345 RepID=UPI00359F84A8